MHQYALIWGEFSAWKTNDCRSKCYCVSLQYGSKGNVEDFTFKIQVDRSVCVTGWRKN